MKRRCDGCGSEAVFEFADDLRKKEIFICGNCYQKINNDDKRKLRRLSDPSNFRQREIDFISVGLFGVHYFMLSRKEKIELLEKIKGYHTSSSISEVGKSDNQVSHSLKASQPTSPSLLKNKLIALGFFGLGSLLIIFTLIPPPLLYFSIGIASYVLAVYYVVKK
jgi:hypothetical protein